MLVEQIIELELREPRPLIIVEHVLQNSVIFMTKQKTSKVNTRVIIYC